MNEEQVSEQVRAALRDILINDDVDWSMSDIARAGMFTEHDGLTVTQTNSPLQLWLIAIADACAESFLLSFEAARGGDDHPWFCRDSIEAWTEQFEGATTFNDPRQAVVWFTWDLMVPGRLPQERFEELAHRAMTLFHDAKLALAGSAHHDKFTRLIADCALKLACEINGDEFEEAGYLMHNAQPAEPKPERPTFD